MARRTLSRPAEGQDPKGYLNYLIDEIEYITGITVAKGERFEIGDLDGTEIVLVSPNGSKYKIGVDNAGNITTTLVS